MYLCRIKKGKEFNRAIVVLCSSEELQLLAKLWDYASTSIGRQLQASNQPQRPQSPANKQARKRKDGKAIAFSNNNKKKEPVQRLFHAFEIRISDWSPSPSLSLQLHSCPSRPLLAR
jgi:hypothetical protein